MNDAVPSNVTAARRLDDWLSPILIKELRQGMRGRIFVISFLVLQVFLILLVLGNVAAATQGMMLEVQTGFFWAILGGVLAVIMPMRGLNAVSQEVTRNTMETVLLTRLTSWRVVFGKWSALFAQSLLFATAVMPYVVVRYFIGGTDVVTELLVLVYFLWLSAILIALAITASALTHIFVRALFLGVVVVLSVGESAAVFQLTRNFTWITGCWMLLTTLCVPALLFELALAGIAPPSENHSIRRRLLALVYFGLSLALWSCAPDGEERTMGLLFPMGALVGICYFELSEKPLLIPRLISPLNRFGGLSRILGVFLLPGWPGALVFSLCVLPLAVWGFTEQGARMGVGMPSMDGLELPLWMCAVLGSVLIPVCICHVLWKSLRFVFFAVLIYNAVLLGLSLVLKGFDELTQAHVFTSLLALLPGVPTLLVSTDGHRGDSYDSYLFLNSLVLAVILIILFAHSIPYFRDLWTLLGQNKNTAPEPITPDPTSEKW